MTNPLALLRARTVTNEAGCWLWTGARTKNGYAVLRWRGRVVYGHRLALMVKCFRQHRAIGGWLACHQCSKHGADQDYKHCVNPDHIERGKQSRNMAQWARRSRARARELAV